MDPDHIVRRLTIVASPPLVPEVRLHLAADLTGLWEELERDLARTNTPPPFWANPWPGGQALARYLLDHPEVAAGRTLLDFGAGSGLVAIAAARAGAARVVAADIDPVARHAIRVNAALNGVEVDAGTRDWLDVTDPEIDVICAADVCYEGPMSSRVIGWLAACARGGATVLLADPGRTYAPREGLVPRARYLVPTTLSIEDREQRDTTVFEVTPALAAGVVDRRSPERAAGADPQPRPRGTSR